MSVVEYAFCKVCRIHHNAGRRHNFTKKHKDRLSVILLKFRKKESWMVETQTDRQIDRQTDR